MGTGRARACIARALNARDESRATTSPRFASTNALTTGREKQMSSFSAVGSGDRASRPSQRGGAPEFRAHALATSPRPALPRKNRHLSTVVSAVSVSAVSSRARPSIPPLNVVATFAAKNTVENSGKSQLRVFDPKLSSRDLSALSRRCRECRSATCARTTPCYIVCVPKGLPPRSKKLQNPLTTASATSRVGIAGVLALRISKRFAVSDSLG